MVVTPTIDPNTCTLSAVVTYPPPTVVDNCDPGPLVACVPPSGSTFPEGTTTVTCTATDSSGNVGTCTFTVTVSAGFGVCYNDAGTGDYFQQNVAPPGPSNPLAGFWRYTTAAGESFCGFAEFVDYRPGTKHSSYDRDDTVVPIYRMECFMRLTSPGGGTVTVTEMATGEQHILRDSTPNGPCPPAP
jgi:hypothetical protein